MNTLTKEQINAFRQSFKKRAKDKDISSVDIMLYNLVRGFPSNRGFSKISNNTKLVNGQRPYQSYTDAKSKLKALLILRTSAILEWFGGTIPQVSETASFFNVSQIQAFESQYPQLYNTILLPMEQPILN
ncbi:MAG: hypothetical protein ACXW2E_01090 [Nitrososphaeraceae archaeon]